MTAEQAFSPGTRRAARIVGRYIAHYLYGMFTKSFNSAALAVDASFGLAAGALVSHDVTAPNLTTVIAIFCASFTRSCLSYFKENPIPEKLPPNLL